DALARDATRDLRVRPLAQHDHVVVPAGRDQRRAEAAREREHADEGEDDERDAERRREAGRGPAQQAPDVVDDRDLHATYLSASTTFRRADCHAGTAALTAAMSSAMATAISAISEVTASPGTNPPKSNSTRLNRSSAPPSPSASPSPAMASDSAMTSRSTAPSVKPSVLSTAISPKRSRADIAIVFAETIRIAKTTAMPIAFRKNPMFPYMPTKARLNAFSVCERVGDAEFS